MDFYTQYKEDNLKLERRYPLYRCPAANADLVSILTRLSIADNIKKSILAIDSAMRLGRKVDNHNKAHTILATDLLSAQFYHYNAEHFDQTTFRKLTECVKRYNLLMSAYDTSQDDALIPEIEAVFVLPFVSIDDPTVQQLINHSELYTK
ncbi:hypothetical protein ERX27_06060 [Macrococcus brunensis]|uniref:Uncharacterized protein n=1 Tax=Macrococcus brunensis TaxID=198483 RepID=A0A4R6BDL0_9STAP|nr:hypothetical protein [Macrococcus brunensis]TDL97819.1 hypothetical protein ERX27_06060 [Macrococcus brunensis]ULG71027.1 hypothetical protein MGG12_06620 [Macrococcus brunensis]ULG73364.1 hypothetical protein MGG13_06480 [Macrococcus brunensis]